MSLTIEMGDNMERNDWDKIDHLTFLTMENVMAMTTSHKRNSIVFVQLNKNSQL